MGWPYSHLPMDCLRISCAAHLHLRLALSPGASAETEPGASLAPWLWCEVPVGARSGHSFPSPWSMKQEDMGC